MAPVTARDALSMERSPPQASAAWRPSAAWALGFLTLVSAFNYLDRAILGLALPLIKRDMVVSDMVLGLVSGLAFALFYSLLGIPIAWWADRWNRRNIVAIGFTLWSLMTALTGWVSNIVQLAVARFFLGSGEACGIAPSHSMLSDLFPEARRPLALALYGLGSSVALLVFFPLVGWTGQMWGWRAMFMAAGTFGLVLAPLFVLSVHEPVRGAAETARAQGPFAVHSLKSTLRFLLGSRTYVLILLGSMFMGAAVYASSTWNASFLTRVHHLRLDRLAASVGPIQGICWGIGTLAGGILTDLLGRRAERWRLLLPALACGLAGLSEVLFLLAPTLPGCLIGLGLTSLFTLVHQGPVFAVAMTVAQVRMRAVAISLLVLSSSLLGQAVGPLLVGFLNDHLGAQLGESAIRYSLLLVAACGIGAGVSFLAAAGFVARDRLRTLGASTR